MSRVTRQRRGRGSVEMVTVNACESTSMNGFASRAGSTTLDETVSEVVIERFLDVSIGIEHEADAIHRVTVGSRSRGDAS
jgi:hypothetical protein